MKLQKHRVSQSERYPRGVERLIKQAGEQDSEAELERYQNQPSTKAREALDQLFRQAQGLAQESPGLPLFRSYSPAPAAPAAPVYKPVAGGDPDAIREYARLVRAHVANLNSLITTHRELLLPISHNSLSWPMQISKRKPFGDDRVKLIKDLEVGKETIANDPKARFNPKSKFGKVAWGLIERIDWHRTYCPIIVGDISPSWARGAQKLRKFTTNASPEERKQWLAVIGQVLDEDFRGPELAESYLHLITGASQKNRKKAVFFDKIREEFYSLWGWNRNAKG